MISFKANRNDDKRNKRIRHIAELHMRRKQLIKRAQIHAICFTLLS